MLSFRRLTCAVLSAATLAACDAPVADPEQGPIFTTVLTASNASGEQPAEFASGEPITFKAVVTNHTSKTQPVVWCSGLANVAIVVRTSDGEWVWHQYDGMGFIQAEQEDSFGPHETRTTRVVWRQDYDNQKADTGPPVPPGHYYAVAEGCASDPYGEGFDSEPVDFLIQ